MFRKPKKILCAVLLLRTAASVPELQAATIAFSGIEQLGKPTDTSITLNVVPQASANIYYEYGGASGPALTKPQPDRPPPTRLMKS